ncbi:transcriptional regulator [Streptomyces mashuensis]|uniref:Transcriptional regulator n=1 Tax=Streptomyces mashuensis TaxID=33904 RepID=A0A919B928_9ACTN|nr:TetR-like C-terminal domain-containing protein [Streptomyces mashuensis]GHF67146.1 transcriptional regulator [Streptomyces mashuensis]
MVRAGITAARLTEAAAAMADEAGLEKVTLSALARHFGVKDASLYSHVRNLRDLHVRIALLASEEMTGRIAAAVAGRSGKEALVAFADAYRDFALERPGRYAATQLQLAPEEVADSVGFRRSVELTYGMLRAYGLAEPDLTDAGRLLRSTFHGYVHLELSGGFGHTRPVRESWARSLDALHLVLTNWPSRPDGSNR